MRYELDDKKLSTTSSPFYAIPYITFCLLSKHLVCCLLQFF